MAYRLYHMLKHCSYMPNEEARRFDPGTSAKIYTSHYQCAKPGTW
jgi:hypothetical protein